jgi:transcriptional regulator with XRE-family HTH domain
MSLFPSSPHFAALHKANTIGNVIINPIIHTIINVFIVSPQFNDIIPHFYVELPNLLRFIKGYYLEMDVKKLLGQRIKELRTAKRLKQSELAEAIGIEPRSVSKMESGCHFPKDTHLAKIASILNVDIKDLFDFSSLPEEKEDLLKAINKILSNADKNKLKTYYQILMDLTS